MTNGRMSGDQRRALDEALDPYELTSPLRAAIQRHLGDYTAWRRDLADAERKRLKRPVQIELARRLLALEREDESSPLLPALEARLKYWESLQALGVGSTRKRSGHPKDWARRILTWRTMEALDEAGIPGSHHRDSPRVRLLREVLRLADGIDEVRPSSGSLRIILDVGKHYRERGRTPQSTMELAAARLWPRR